MPNKFLKRGEARQCGYTLANVYGKAYAKQFLEGCWRKRYFTMSKVLFSQAGPQKNSISIRFIKALGIRYNHIDKKPKKAHPNNI